MCITEPDDNNPGLLILARFFSQCNPFLSQIASSPLFRMADAAFLADAGGLLTTFLLNHNPDFNRKCYRLRYISIYMNVH